MPATTPALCPACGAQQAPAARFCEQCGGAVPPKPPKRPIAAHAHRGALQRARAKAVDSELSAIRQARICLGIIAGLLLLAAALGWFGMESELTKARQSGAYIRDGVVAQIKTLIAANVVLSVGFVGLAIWAGRNAFAAVLTGLVLYVCLILASAAVAPITLVQGIVIKVIIIGLLVGGIRAALRQRQRQRQASTAA